MVKLLNRQEIGRIGPGGDLEGGEEGTLVPGSLMTPWSHQASPGLFASGTVSLREKEASALFQLLLLEAFLPMQPDLILSHTVGKSSSLQRYTLHYFLRSSLGKAGGMQLQREVQGK